MSKLYIISPPQIELDDFRPKLEAALVKYKPAYFQLRLKPSLEENYDYRLMVAKDLYPICKKYNVSFIVNDDVKIAAFCADGVHVGDEDSSVANARALLGKNKIIGASCYNSLELAREAVKQDTNYVSFGAFYPTTTKQAKSRAEIKTLEAWKKESSIPVSAIGGIDFENKKPIEDAGADYICMISAIWKNS